MHGAVKYAPNQCNPSSYLTRVARLLLPDSLKLTADFIDTALGNANVVLDLGDLVQHGVQCICGFRHALHAELPEANLPGRSDYIVTHQLNQQRGDPNK